MLRINLTKEVKDHYTENSKTLMKEMKEDTNKWKDTLCLWTGRINIIKMSTPPKPARLNAIPIKIPVESFKEIGKIVLKIYMEP